MDALIKRHLQKHPYTQRAQVLDGHNRSSFSILLNYKLTQLGFAQICLQ